MTQFKRMNAENFFQLGVDQSPQSFLDIKSDEYQLGLNNEQFALIMDHQDPLGYVRQEFFYPKMQTLPNGLYRKFNKNKH
jgi:hypothetical protein